MPVGVKRKSSASELDLDALFADLDATVKGATRQRATPKKSVPFSPQYSKSENTWQLSDAGEKSAEREHELLALCDGLGDSIALMPAKPTRRVASRHSTPLRKRVVCHLSRLSCQWSPSHVPSSSPHARQHRTACQRRTSMLLLTVLIGMNSTKHQPPRPVYGRNKLLHVPQADIFGPTTLR
jgi:hypothetical protein